MAKTRPKCYEIAKIWTINRKEWSPRTIVVPDLPSHSMLTWFFACTDNYVVLNMRPYTILVDNSIYVNRAAIEVTQWIGKSGSAISDSLCRKYLPPSTHWSCDTVHAQTLQTHSQWYPIGNIRAHNSRTEVDNATRHISLWPLTKIKGSKAKATSWRNVSPASML